MKLCKREDCRDGFIWAPMIGRLGLTDAYKRREPCPTCRAIREVEDAFATISASPHKGPAFEVQS